MRLDPTVIGLGTLAALAALAVSEPEARACGGCFPPPGEQQSVVTDHRMILSVSKEPVDRSAARKSRGPAAWPRSSPLVWRVRGDARAAG